MTEIFNEDCLVTMKRMADNSVDSIVTDPPAGISFMGKHWDGDRGGRDHWIKWLEEIMKEGLRVLKPGGHAFVWAFPRTSHWTAMALENAGFEIRDCVYHVFGSGFPKSLDISKAIDKKFGAERKIVGKSDRGSGHHLIKLNNHAKGDTGIGYMDGSGRIFDITSPTTERAKQSDGWGTALKPAVECWWLCRKPLSEKTIAENVLKWGVGGINIDDCRISVDPGIDDVKTNVVRGINSSDRTWNNESGFHDQQTFYTTHSKGRFPSNFIHDGSDEVLGYFPDAGGQQGDLIGHDRETESPNGIYGKQPPRYDTLRRRDNTKSASRFFYCAKPSPTERNMGCSDLPLKPSGVISETSGQHLTRRDNNAPVAQNNHPTVKALTLMEYLVTMITPPGGTCYDLFAGSGTTLMACEENEINGIGSETEFDYCEIAKRRVGAVKDNGQQSIFK